MEQFRNGGKKTNIWVWIITGFFLAVGITFIVIANFNAMVEWFRVFGITLVVLCAPVLLWLIYQVIKHKIKDM
jgi:uncharacterized membrane protein (DUF485 family)